MTHRLLRLSALNSSRKQNSSQKFKYLLVLDFEATCQRHTRMKPQEIIELPCLALSTDQWKVEDVFHTFVKPRINLELTPYCTDLTGIIQDMVDNSPHFHQVFTDFESWLSKGEYFRDQNTSAFVTCGDWDLRVMLPAQCSLDQITVPQHYQKWINLKQSFSDATKLYPRSLKDMLKHLELPLTGRLHSGIDDVHNMTKIIISLANKYQTNFDINTDVEYHKLKFYA